MSQVLVEVLPNIHVCNIYILLPGSSEACQDVVIKKSECVVQLLSGRKMCLKLPRGICLVPGEVKCMSHEKEVVTVRVQLDDKTSLISTLAANLKGDSVCESPPPSISLSESVLCGQCKACEHQVFQHAKLGRVLPLPSLDWEQASEDWFCHIHKEDSMRLKPTSLQPKKDECFYTELYFLFHRSVVKHTESSDPTERPEINCVKCSLPLGVLLHQSVKLWTHNLLLKKEDEVIVHSTDVNTIMVALVHKLEKDNFGVNCRLVLHLQTFPKKYLYMVTMNTNQKLLIPKNSKLLRSLVCRREKELQEGLSQESVCGNSQAEVWLQAVFGVKLLFVVKEGDDEETGEWADSVDTHLIPCSSTFFREVHALLEASNSCLPENIRLIGNMRVGYIFK